MNKNIIFLYLICLVFICNSCSTNKVETNECYLEEQNELLSTTDIFSTVTFLPLETNDDFIIGSVNKILKVDDFYYILDLQTKTIFIYDEMGKSVNKISKVGSGPNEYSSIEDFIVDKNYITLLCFPRKLIFINKETLNIENQFKIPGTVYYSRIAGWNGSILLCNYHDGKIDKYSDSKITNIFRWDVLTGYIPSPDPAFYMCNDELFFQASGDDVIYHVEQDLTFSVFLTFNYHKKEKSIDFYSARNPEPLKKLSDIAEYPLVNVSNIFRSNNGIGFVYSFAGLLRISYINNFGTRIHKLLNIPIPKALFLDNKLISWIYPFQIDNKRFDGMNIRNDSDSIVKHDNPVLLVYDFKIDN
jgi:hypothetical protein